MSCGFQSSVFLLIKLFYSYIQKVSWTVTVISSNRTEIPSAFLTFYSNAVEPRYSEVNNSNRISKYCNVNHYIFSQDRSKSYCFLGLDTVLATLLILSRQDYLSQLNQDDCEVSFKEVLI